MEDFLGIIAFAAGIISIGSCFIAAIKSFYDGDRGFMEFFTGFHLIKYKKLFRVFIIATIITITSFLISFIVGL